MCTIYADGLYNEVKKANEMRTDVSKFFFYSMAHLFIRIWPEKHQNILNKEAWACHHHLHVLYANTVVSLSTLANFTSI